MANQRNPSKSVSKPGALPEWWPPLRKDLEKRLRQHRKNQRIASERQLPKAVSEWIKKAKADGTIPGMKRVLITSPDAFYPAYEKLFSLGGTLDEGDGEGKLDSVLVWFGSQDGVLTKKESKLLTELEKKPRGWLRRDPLGREPSLLAITHSEHEWLKRDKPKLLEGVEVSEIPEDEEAERLRLKRKLDEARVTEICFSPDFDTGKMTAMRCGPVPDDLLRKECSRAGRNLWHESPGGPPASGKPTKEVADVLLARDIAARLKQNAVEQWPEKDEIGKRLIALVDSVEDQGRFAPASNVAASIERNQSTIQEAAGSAVGKIYRSASQEAVRVLDACRRLADRLQRPPTRKELREAVKWQGEIKEYTMLLREVGLAWLPEDHASKGNRRSS
jgi:hypothetical protein